MNERFQVATVRGYPIGRPDAWRGGKRQKEGLTATVCDTLYNWRVIKTYRSEYARMQPGGGRAPLGIDGALAAAEDHALYLSLLFGDR